VVSDPGDLDVEAFPAQPFAKQPDEDSHTFLLPLVEPGLGNATERAATRDRPLARSDMPDSSRFFDQFQLEPLAEFLNMCVQVAIESDAVPAHAPVFR